MKLHKKALNAEQVKQRLIKAAAKQNAANQKRLAESKRKFLKYGRKSNAKWRKAYVRRLEREMENLRKQKIGMQFTKKHMAEALKLAEMSRDEKLLWKREHKKAMAKAFPPKPTLSMVGG